jgi:aspartyl-tRNA(Asn)/glutamyl-tRNA(Gln) amidotransferase subunit A
MSKLHYLSATEALRLFRRRELSPVELMQDVIDRCEAVNPVVNALTETMFEESLAAAREAEKRYLQLRPGEAEPGTELLGLPVAAKEKHAMRGRSFTQGLIHQVGALATDDHPVIERIVTAGGIVHARTTSPEFSCATVTHSPLWGVTRNPWNPTYSPGGSSGGAGASLAAGMATLATASDIAGSTRLPASFTGTVGYKAPYGRIPGMGVLAADWYRGDGPMARTVADVELLAGVMSGRHPRDHATVEGTSRPIGRFESVRGKRIALCIRLGDYLVAPEIEENTRRTAAALTAAGCEVEEITLPWHSAEIVETIFTHFGYILGPAMAKATAGHEGQLAAYTRRFMEDAAAAAGRNTFLEGLEAEHRMQSELAEAMEGFDALLCPTSAVPQLDAEGDYLDGITLGEKHLGHYWQAHMTSPFNIANRCPVLAVPSGASAEGVPTGVQIVGHPFAEATVFNIGAALEAVAPWEDRRPSL